MNYFSLKNFIIAGLSIVLVAVFGLVAQKQYKENKALTSRLDMVDNQLSAMTKALQDSTTISQTNKNEIQELTNRSNAIKGTNDSSLTDMVSKASPAVVSIVISKDVPLLQTQYVNPFGNDPAFQGFNIQVPVFKQVGTQSKQIGAGSGFIIRNDGYILTNKHVVADASADYTVLLSSGVKKTAKVVYRDPSDDVAIVKIDGTAYPIIEFGDSNVLKLGQTVAAIGNALGEYNNSVSVGIISGLDRKIQARDASGNVETLSGVIQTDAAINPGNSGGPLLDLAGHAIGMNVATDQGASNIAFSIPTARIQQIVNSVIH